jgi:hypothetical protein
MLCLYPYLPSLEVDMATQKLVYILFVRFENCFANNSVFRVHHGLRDSSKSDSV